MFPYSSRRGAIQRTGVAEAHGQFGRNPVRARWRGRRIARRRSDANCLAIPARGPLPHRNQGVAEFYTRVRDCYLDLAKAEPERFVVVDASGTLDQVSALIDELANEILKDK